MKDNIVELFFDIAGAKGSKTAIVHKKASISYRDLAANVQSTSVYLLDKGIQKGDKVLVFIPMSIQLYTTVLALFSLGAVVVFVDEWSDKSRLEKAISVVHIDTIIAPRKLIWLAYILPAFRKIKRKFSISSKIKKALHSYQKMHPDDTALITFTTGSTGLPKAANRTHKFLWEQFRILKDEIDAKESDHCLITLPIVLLSILGTGATGYIADFNQKKPHKLDAERQVQFAKRHHVSLLIASPFFIEQMAKLGIDQIPTIRRVLTGGAPVFPQSAQLIQSSFSKSENMIAYGSTEAEPIATLSMKSLLHSHADLSMGLCVGKLHHEVQCKIVRMTDQAISLGRSAWSDWELSSGELGEIVVTGPHVLDRYYNSEKAFKENKIQINGVTWHRTGDSGILIDGMLYLHGRCSQLIVLEGSYISPFIVENQLMEINGIRIGTLLQVKQELVICLEVEQGERKEDIENAVRQLDIPYTAIHILESIPRDPRHFSKIDYGKLKLLLPREGL